MLPETIYVESQVRNVSVDGHDDVAEDDDVMSLDGRSNALVSVSRNLESNNSVVYVQADEAVNDKN